MSPQLLFGLVAIVPIVFIIIACKLWGSYTKGCTERVIGAIAHTNSQYHYHASTESKSSTTTSYYGFNYNGQYYVVRARSNWGYADENGNVELFIDPINPNRHYRKADLYNVLVFGGLGLAMLIVLAILYFQNV